jgi:hypothetical protein
LLARQDRHLAVAPDVPDGVLGDLQAGRAPDRLDPARADDHQQDAQRHRGGRGDASGQRRDGGRGQQTEQQTEQHTDPQPALGNDRRTPVRALTRSRRGTVLRRPDRDIDQPHLISLKI